jgi:protein-S-isoprenylcysteine O-methyltransferase Ste14
MIDSQHFLILMCLIPVLFYGATALMQITRRRNFIIISTIFISFGILVSVPIGYFFNVLCVALAVSIVSWRCSMIIFDGIPSTLRMARQKGFKIQWSWPEVLALAEPLVQTGVAVMVLATRPLEEMRGNILMPIVGAMMALLYPKMLAVAHGDSKKYARVGHMIQSGHKLVQSGVYELVRHPQYFAALWLWVSLAIALKSILVLIFAIAYALPTLVIYARAEEKQLEAVFGDEYRDYRQRTPAFIPKKPIALLEWLIRCAPFPNIKINI